MKNRFKLTLPQIGVVALLLIVFVLDVYLPKGFSMGKLYILIFFLICNQNRKVIIRFAMLTCLIGIAKFIILYDPHRNVSSYINRLMTIVSVGIIAAISIHYRMLTDRMNSERLSYEKQLEEMLLMTSHQVRKPLANFFGLLNLFEGDKTLTEAEQNFIINHLKSSAKELDSFTKELTLFMGDLKNKKPQEFA